MSLYPIYYNTQDISNSMHAIIHSNIKEAQRETDHWFAFSKYKTGSEYIEKNLSSLGTSSILPYTPAQEKHEKHGKIQSLIIPDFANNFNTGTEFEDVIILSGEKSLHPSLLIADLGWSRKKAIDARMRLVSFEEDWDAPGMELYDRL